jgi:glucose/arabinose dehydrogenase
MTDDIEQGLLGLAFDPDFGDNGTLYIAYSGTPAEQRGLIVRRLVATDPAADRFDGTDEVVLRAAGLPANHNGGDLRFGPDGMLYVSVGAGPGEPRDHGHAAATDTLLGKILRLDVRQPGRKGPSNRCGRDGGPVSYSIPDNNPFAGQRGQCGEIWLYGLRNPWRLGIDAGSGDLWVGDVGKDREELSVYRAGSELRDLGFPRCQGRHDFPSTGAEDCPQRTGTLAPVYEYAGRYRGRCAITGGLPYRGAIAALRGAYVFGDACSSEIIIGRPAAGGAWDWQYWDAGIAPGYGTVASFGEDADGELYLVNHLAGAVYRIQ